MTKKKTTKADGDGSVKDEQIVEVTQYVILVPAMYKVMIPEEYEFIDPSDEKYADRPPIRTLEHLGKADINRLLIRNIVKEYEGE